MTIRTLNRRLLAMTLSLSAALGVASQAHAYDVYRGVKADNGAVKWTNESFGVSGEDTPTLSFSYFASDGEAQKHEKVGASPCILKVALEGAPEKGETRNIGGNIRSNTVPTFRPSFPWTMTFDNKPEGHWSIAKETIMNVSNAMAGTVSAVAFKTLAERDNPIVTVINGTSDNCRIE